MTETSPTDHRRGLMITGLGGLALSIDVPLLRLGQGEIWSVLAVRSLTTFGVGLLLWMLVRRFSKARPPLLPGKAGALAGLFYGLSSMTFLGAVFHTSTANVVFIVAFTPMFAALLAWLFFKERPSAATLVTMVAMIFGVSLIVSAGMAGGHLAGDLLAAVSALLLAGAITTGRAFRLQMGFVPLIATALPAAVGLAMALPAGIVIAHPSWILLDGALMIPLAFWCLATGPRYLSGPEVGMFYLLETILAPLWVWMIFAEVPTARSLVGGVILVGSLVGYSAWQMRVRRGTVTAF
jgi:drug/metabolite transporter (DMT)-like permease